MPETLPPTGWIALAAFLVGLVVRAIKTDTMKVALATLGLPPIPTRALPWAALVLGGVAAVLDAKVSGASWNAAAQAGVYAAALAVFGHELGSGLPGVKKLLGVAIVIGFTGSLTACSFLQKHGPTIVDLLADNAKCAIANQNLPNDEILRVCGVRPENAERVLEILGESRLASAHEAAAARADEASLARARAPMCGSDDAGVP